MRKIILACMIGLSGCATVGGIPVNKPALGQTVIDEKALYAAEELYNVPAQAYVSALNNGLITPSLKAQIKPKLQYAAKLLKSLRAAYAVGDAATFAEKVQALKAFKADIGKYLLE